MSWGASLGDIPTTAKILYKVYDQGLRKSQGANAKYRQFRDDIHHLACTLEEFGPIYEVVTHERLLQERWPRSGRDILKATQTGPQLMQDFRMTIRECERVLAKYSHLEQQQMGVLKNLQWNFMGAGRDVDDLKHRVHDHICRIMLDIKPLEFQLLTNRLSPHLDNIIHLDQTAPHDFSVPSRLAKRFQDAIYINRPPLFHLLSHFPLEEGWDALVYHLSASKAEFSVDGDSHTTVELSQLLSLMKSRWILQKLKEGVPFQQAGPGSLWAKCITRAERDIFTEHRRFSSGHLANSLNDVVDRLRISAFETWTVHQLADGGSTTNRAPEHVLLEMPFLPQYGSSNSILTFFRNGEGDLRIAQSSGGLDATFLESEGHRIHIPNVVFVPAYARRTTVSIPSSNDVCIYNKADRSRKEYLLPSEDNAHAFQHAVTGFRVVGDSADMSWAFKRSWSSGPKFKRCRVQLWQWEPLPSFLESSGSQGARAIRRPSSVTASPSLSTSSISAASGPPGSTFSAGPGFKVSGSGPTRAMRLDVLSEPTAPGMVVFESHGTSYTLTHLSFEQGVRVTSTKCRCEKLDNACQHFAIESVSKGKINLRRYGGHDSSEKGMLDWDVMPIARQGHPQYRRLEFAQNSGLMEAVEWICFHFDSTEGRDNFEKAFEQVAEHRNSELTAYKLEQRNRQKGGGGPASPLYDDKKLRPMS